MKRLLAFLFAILAIAVTTVWAQTTSVGAVTNRGVQLIRGTSNVGTVVATKTACWATVPADVLAQGRLAGKSISFNYKCVETEGATATYTPPPICPAQPASSVASVNCTSPKIGTQTVTTTYTKALTATACTWTAVVGSPVGVCTDPPPVVVPPVTGTTWSKIAAEGADFTLATAKTVRFGYRGWEDVGSAWADAKTLAPGTYKCGIAIFSTNGVIPADPKPGNSKACEVSAAAVTVVEPPAPPANPTPTPTPTPAPVTDMPSGPQVKLIPALNQNPPGGWSKDMLIATNEVAPVSDIGAFRTGCQIAKYAKDDPIVFPGQPGKSHWHTFFGNTGIDAYSTAASLSTTGNSTCRGGTINRSAYWVPSMVDTRNGAILAPMFESNFYYKTGYALPPSSITEVPMGLRMIAGDPKGSPTSPSSAAIYSCVWDGGNSNWFDHIPPASACPAIGYSWLIMGVDFPQCWDGKNLDSPDHKSHMTNPVNVKANNTGNCPASHPVALPQIAYQVLYHYNSSSEIQYWRLSSDNYDTTKPAGYSGHGDYFMAWKPEIVKVWTQKCDREQKDCHSHLLGDGRQMVIP